MGRPKASPYQHRAARELHREGLKPKAITIQLEHEFDEPVSLSTVEKWCRNFRKYPTGDNLLDSPFNWENMDKAEIPWEAGRYLLSVWRRLTEVGQLKPPSFRHMRWWWRVHSAAPGLGFTETLKVVTDLEVSEENVELQDELFFTSTLANASSKYVGDRRRDSLRAVLLRARSNKLQTETQGSFFDNHTFGEEQQ